MVGRKVGDAALYLIGGVARGEALRDVTRKIAHMALVA